MDLASLYQHRFTEADRLGKVRIWQVLVRIFFQPLIGMNKVVLDLACGYGEFINAVAAKKKYAVDLNPDAAKFLNADVSLYLTSATIIPVEDRSIDVVFTSNFLEHLKSKDECNAVFAEVRRILKPGGKFVIMGPNIRYLADRYWDFYDHHLPLSHLSLEEGLIQAGYEIDRMIPKFLPYTAKTSLPKHPLLVSAYLRLPFAWRFIGRQFLLVARRC